MAEKLLEIKDLWVEFKTDDALVQALNGVNITINKGEAYGLVGETGAGKTTTCKSILRLLPDRVSRIKKGEILFGEKDILKFSEEQLLEFRGKQCAMIFQDPMTSLNPVLTVGDQVSEVLQLHYPHQNEKQIQERVDELFKLVGLPPQRKTEYPHEFSGGMKQRIVIAMGLACQPSLLLADEPTTALDVTIQLQILKLMLDLKKQLQTAMILVTHDLGIVAKICDRAGIMYAGEIIEDGDIKDIFEGKYHHPYTEGLFGAIPDLTKKTRRLNPIDGLMPDPADLPRGCRFNPRCPKCMDICREQGPKVIQISDSHSIKCHLFNDK
ncbi:MAG: ABC transporter ATP-binding protein [Lutisporaceae bacterium]|jgi:peptide/nickel transport system ATP-binding protein